MPSQDLVVKLKAENAELKSRVKESERALKDFQKAAQDAAKQSNNQGWSKMLTNLTGIKTGAGGASGGLGLMTGALGKLAGGLGIAVGAGALFNRFLENSNSLGDEFERIQTQAGAAVDYLGYALVNCDFSNFLTNLGNSVQLAGELADYMDRVNTAVRQFGARSAGNAVQIAQKRLEQSQYGRNDPRREQLQKEIVDLQRQDASTGVALGKAISEGAYKAIMTQAGNAGDDARRYAEEYLKGPVEQVYNETTHQLEDRYTELSKDAEMYRKILKGNRGQGAIIPGATGPYRMEADQQAAREAREAAEQMRREGKTLRQLQTAYNIDEMSDGPDSKGQKLTAQYIQGQQMIAQNTEKQAAAQEKLTLMHERNQKAAVKAQKAHQAELKKTYNSQAYTVFGIQANITALTELQDKADPLSEKFKEIGEEIQDWKDKLDRINISRLEPGSMGRMNAELSQWTAVRDRSAMDSKSYQDADYHVRQLADAIQKANEKQNELMRPTDKEWQSKAYNDIIKQVRWLQQELNKIDWSINPDQYNAMKDQLKAAQDELQGPPPLKDSIEAITRALQDLEEQYNRTGDAAKRSAIKQRMAAMEKKLEKAQKGYTLDDELTRQPSQKNQQALESYDAATEQVNKTLQLVEIGVIGGKEARAIIDGINKVLEKLGAEPIEIKILTPGMKKALQNINLAADAMSSLGQAFGAMSQMAEDDAGLAVAGIIAESIANIALGAAQATVQAAQTSGPWVWLAFSVAAMAQMASMIAQIHSATAMASGGIVPGSSYSGDQVSARLNSGEMVLNRRQQTHLFDALDSGRIGGGSETVDVEWRLRGKDLYGSVRNYSKVAGKAGRRTGIR